MGIMTCPVCKGQKTVRKTSGTKGHVDTGVSDDIELIKCPDCNGKGYKATDDVW